MPEYEFKETEKALLTKLLAFGPGMLTVAERVRLIDALKRWLASVEVQDGIR